MPTSNVNKFLPARMLAVLGKNLPGIVGATNEGIESIEQNIQACIDQLFLATASGKYLINLGEQDGFTLPLSSGLDIRAYRVLVPIMVSSPKQIRITINDLIQAFYGAERTKPNLTSSTFGPYSLASGDDLVVETESGIARITILADQVSNLNSVTATELSAIINYSQDLLLADTVINRQTGEKSLRITSKTAGLSAYVKVVGGKLQNVLKFPKLNDTNITSGSGFTLTKTSALTDEITFTWDGIGVNPQLYTVNTGDILTIRGLTAGAFPSDLLNDSYKIVDVGYNYFKVRNANYTNISSTLTLNNNSNFVFTKDEPSTLFDLSEFGFSSEVENQTITITVPAIPPLTLRFLQGSTHLQGIEASVLDFTRTSVQIQLLAGQDKPIDLNQIVLFGPMQRHDFTKKKYLTYLSNASTTIPVYQIETNNDVYSPFPYTTPTPIGLTNPIYGTVGSSEYTVRFPNYAHGLNDFWGTTLSGGTSSGTLLAADINKEHQVTKVIDDLSVKIRIRDANETPIEYTGVGFGPVDVYRQSTPQSDSSDGYLSFPSSGSLIAAGFSVGDTFRFDPGAGTDVVPFYASRLKFGKPFVTSIVNTGLIHRVQFSSGIGVGLDGLVISNSQGFRSGYFGGTMSYFFDKTTALNQERVMTGLKAMFINHTPSSNPDYVGAFVYDPTGAFTQFTVSKFVTSLSNTVLKGETFSSIQVSNLSFGSESFPESGKLILGYGTDKLEGPIRFYSTNDNVGVKQISIDPAYKFKFTHDSETTVQYIHATQAYVPGVAGEDYPSYVTGTSASREALFGFIRLLTATGIFVERSVQFPELTYDDPGIFPFS